MASHAVLLEVQKRQESHWMHEIGASLSLTDARRKNNGVLTYPSYEVKRDRKGNEIARIPVTCRIQDFTKNDTFQKWCDAHGHVAANLIHLSQVEAYRDQYVPWLRSFSERYANLDGAGQVWLHKEVLYGIAWRTLENKWRGWYALEDKNNPPEDYWANESLRDLYGFCYLVRKEQIPATAKLVNKMLKDEESELSASAIDTIARVVIDQLYLAGIRSDIRVIEESWQEKEQRIAMSRQQRAEESAI